MSGLPADFNVKDPATWPPVLTLDMVAAIYQRSREAIRHALKPTSKVVFTPTPFRRHPARWRKVDVLRDIDPSRQALQLRRSA